jgi:hypothetical protein
MYWYEQAALQGLPAAQWRLGSLWASGGEGIAPDPKKASLWCKRSANAGFAPAQATLGTLFAQAGKYERAVLWWGRAAEQGDAESQFNLANACRTGKGLKTDLEQAFALMLKAAESGVAAAQTLLGVMYATGDGVAEDRIEAARWFCCANSLGDSPGKSNWERAQTLFTTAQLQEAGRRAKCWLDAWRNKA